MVMNVKATPNGTRTMWKPRGNAICSRAGSSCEGSEPPARAAARWVDVAVIMAPRAFPRSSAPCPDALPRGKSTSRPRPGRQNRPVPARQNLIFDADDTLWENNVIFERVVDDFIDWLAHPTQDAAAIRQILAEIEEANIVAHGYGSQVFLRSLKECFTHLTERPVSAVEQARFDDFAEAFAANKVE